MTNYKEIDAIIRTYSEKYRHPSLPEIKISGLYDLFPDEELTLQENIGVAWPEKWPYCEERGVYVILDVNADIIYIGHATTYFGIRLGNYFMYGENNKCALKDPRIKNPRFVVMIAVPMESWFEAAALEAYLIDIIKPPCNTKGK